MRGVSLWFKSTYSDSATGNCVELARRWSKASYSDDDGGGNCVEADGWSRAIRIRDSKANDTPPRLAVPARAWADFITSRAATCGVRRCPGRS
ncbi:DUF397 domain-containing protein [Streptomyces griseocarneus]|nr:DUF397 domain-containing protein [Streptomyces griseocarneus]